MIASEAAAGGLFPSAAFAVGDAPYSVTVADLDGDTVPDLLTANADSDDVSVLLGNGDGSFQTAVFFAAGGYAYSICSRCWSADGAHAAFGDKAHRPRAYSVFRLDRA